MNISMHLQVVKNSEFLMPNLLLRNNKEPSNAYWIWLFWKYIVWAFWICFYSRIMHTISNHLPQCPNRINHEWSLFTVNYFLHSFSHFILIYYWDDDVGWALGMTIGNISVVCQENTIQICDLRNLILFIFSL